MKAAAEGKPLLGPNQKRTSGRTRAMSSPHTKHPTSRQIEAHGIRLHIHEWMGPDPTLVCLHPLGFTGRVFASMAEALFGSHRILCPDLRGHGRSDKPPEGYQYPNLCRDLAGMLQMLHLHRIILLGHTWGADIAMAFAAAHPKRLEGLIVIDGGYRFRRTLSPEEERLSPDRIRSSPEFSSMEEALHDAREQLDVSWTDHVEAAVRDSLEISPQGTARYRLSDPQWQRIFSALFDYDPAALFKKVRVPTLIVHPTGQRNEHNDQARFQARSAALLMDDATYLPIEASDNINLLTSPVFHEYITCFIEGRLNGRHAIPPPDMRASSPCPSPAP